MNKNKIIFGIIGALFILIIVYIVANLNSNPDKIQNKSGNFTIWMIGDSNTGGEQIITNFKNLHPKYANKEIIIEIFSNYEDYSLALMSSIIKDKAPDIFMLNNNEKNSVFSEQIVGINPDNINPNDFRKKFKGVFADDLILTSGEIEFLVGMPVGYETLGIFYNRRFVKDSEINSIAGLTNIIAELKEKTPNLVPIGIGNGSTVLGVSDIITQFFMLEDGVNGLFDLTGNKAKQGMSSYFIYGDESGYNGFDSRFMELSNQGKNSIDLFSKGTTYMVVGYPRLINEIDKKGFSKNFLLASPFPHYSTTGGKSLVNYNYFVINKDSIEYELANDFITYLSSDIGAENFLENFPYYLPALMSLESDKLDEKIHPKYNIVLDDFFNPDYQLGSFDKGIKTLYDKNIISILDNAGSYDTAFSNFRNNILCKAKKISTLEKLSINCE